MVACRRVGRARHSQIRTFVGRRIHAAAAKSSDSLSLETKCGESASWHRGIQMKFPSYLTVGPRESLPAVWSVVWSLFFQTSLSVHDVLLLRGAEPGNCQGQWYTAIKVIVVSRQLDKVRVEQNHCHGLQRDNASYKQRVRSAEGWARFWRILFRLPTAVHAVRVPRP